MKRRYFWARAINYIELSIVFLVPLLLLLGVWGFRIYFPDSGDEDLSDATWLDYFYHSTRAFILEWDAPDGPKPWQLEIFRWLAPFSIFAGAIVLLKNVLKREIPRFHAKWLLTGHTIICGLGTRGLWICRHLGIRNKCVVVEIDDQNDFLSELSSNVPGIIGNAKDTDVIRDAGLTKARRVAIVAGDDETNLIIAREVAEIRGDLQFPEIVAAVEDYVTRSYFSEKLWLKKSLRLRVVGFRHIAFLRLARDIAELLANRLGPVPDRPPVICIETDDDYQLELIRALVMLVQISGERPPVLHVCSCTEIQKHYFHELFPATYMVAKLHWHTEPALKLHRKKSFGKNVDAAVFAMADDSVSLYTAERFEIVDPDDCIVFSVISDTDDILSLAKNSQHESSKINIRSIYDINDNNGTNAENLFELCEQGARAIAAKYDQMYNKGIVEPFENKSVHDRESNRIAAMHAGVKRTLWKNKGEVPDSVMMTHLCCCENARWKAFHAMNGWNRQDREKKKDLHRKLHPLMIPFSELPDEEKQKDENPVKWALDNEF